MELSSNDFNHEGDLPSLYTCDGDDISPHLKWEGIPEGVKSFALTCIDPDAPGGDFIHWLVANIPASTTELHQDCGCPIGSLEAVNDFGKVAYGGPCPPSGKHRYVFTVYALDIEKLEGLNRENFLSEVEAHTLDSVEIIGLYQRSK